MAKNDTERHRYGQHYTPEVVARLLAAFAIRSPGDLAFDPSCGDGRLLQAAQQAKIALASAQSHTGGALGALCFEPAQSNPLGGIDDVELFGIDRSDDAVAKASRTGARAAVADFFDVRPGGQICGSLTVPSQFDAIIGNPPYIRQELLGSDKSRIARLLGSRAKIDNTPRGKRPGRISRNGSSEPGPGEVDGQVHVPRWSGRSDIYVYFFAHAGAFLRPGGRLVFLTASSWLDVDYGTQLQEFMMRDFRIVVILESAVESFFEDASVNTSITVLEREPDTIQRNQNPVQFIQMLKPLDEIMPDGMLATIELARRLERGTPPQQPGAMRIRVVNQGELHDAAAEVGRVPGIRTRRATSKAYRRPNRQATWGRFLRAEDVFFRVLEKGHHRFTPLSDLASVRFGVKTGANDFFYVRPEPGEGGASANCLPVMRPLESLARVRRGITTGANEFFYVKSAEELTETRRRVRPVESVKCVAVQNGNGDIVHIEPEYLRPVVFSLKEIPGIEIKDRRTRMLFFDCGDEREQLKGTRAIQYIRAGERAGIHKRPTCSARAPWYGVARGKEPAPLIFPSKVGERWVVAINQAGVYEDKKLYGVFPGRRVPVRLLAALLNSTWARYYGEMTCRQLTGAQAIADIDVAVAGQILLPDPETLGARERRGLTAALSAIARRRVCSIFDEVRLPDRQLLDELVLAAIGFGDEAERKEVLMELYGAATDLVRSRLARSRSAVSQDRP